jgi:tetratricopeptide (TPR) repeat protein
MASPSDPKASRLEEEALRLARHGSFRAAGDICRILNTHHPQFAPGWRTASSIALQLGDPSTALTLVERGLTLAPQDGRCLLQKAHCLRALRRHTEALAIANTARQAVNDDAAALDALGTFFSLSGEHRLVRQSLYDSSLAKWRHYESQLEGLRGQLLGAGIDVGS